MFRSILLLGVIIFYAKKFSGVWYGVQAENDIPSCEIHNVERGSKPFKYVISTETQLSTPKQQYVTSIKEHLSVIDIEVLSKMSVTPMPRISDALALRTSSVVESNFTVVKTNYKTYAVTYRSDGYITHSYTKHTNAEQCADEAKLWSRTRDLDDKFFEKMMVFTKQIGEYDIILYGLDDISNRTGCEIAKNSDDDDS